MVKAKSTQTKTTQTKSATLPTEVITPQDRAWGAIAQQLSRFWSRRIGLTRSQVLLATGWSLLAAIAVGSNVSWIQRGDRQVQSLFWNLQFKAPPNNIVILGIDEATQVKISRWPLPRATYGKVIDQLMQAGARGVAVDILFDNPSSLDANGQEVSEDCDQVKPSADDRALRDALARHPGKVTLATAFASIEDNSLSQRRLLVPFCPFQTVQARMGSIDFLQEDNGNIHRLGQYFLHRLAQQSERTQLSIQDYGITSFAEAALQSANLDYAKNQSGDIYFYGGRRTFETFSLADVVQPENWKSRFNNGEYFRGKLVLIGATDQTLGDIKDTARGKMPGVELHANAIATLLQNRAVRPALVNPWAIGSLVFVVVMLAALRQAKGEKTQWRLLWTLALMLGWASLSYGLMVQASLLLPVLLPVGAIGLTGTSFIGLDLAKEQRNRKQLEKSLIDRARDPVVKDILNQQDDARLKQRVESGQQELLGAKIGFGRYQIIQIHGAGGFGETYIAEDLHRPDRPQCVVKKLSPASSNPKHLKLARRLFQREAETLEFLGQQHDQIPQLLAYFEEDSQFYLVQEFIAGHPLSSEVALGRQLPETKAISVLREILQVLSFVHSKGVIHRDIKPSNLIRRERDNKLVLIDFGAVKGVQTAGDDEIISDLTIGIGTQGYMAPEQQAGHPQFSSDLYALGMMGVQMLTGISPSQLSRDAETGEIDWKSKTHASVGLIEVVSKMISYHYKQRHQSATEVLQDLKRLSYHNSIPEILTELLQESMPGDEDVQETRPWPTQFEEGDDIDLPPTEPPPEQ